MQKSKSKRSQPRQSKEKTATAPAAISFKSKAGVPSFSSPREKGSIRVRRTEFVGTLSNGATTGYSLIGLSAQTPGYDFNPGSSTLFPWLAGVAHQFERFVFHNLSFRVTPSQATATPGRLYLAVDYDYDDNPPSSKLQMMSNQTHVEGSVWNGLQMSCMPSELHPDSRAKFVSHPTRTNFVEPRTAFCGYLIVAVDSPTANLLFDLEVSYDVELHLPVFDEPMAIDSSIGAPTKAIPSDLLVTPYKAGWVARPIVQDLTAVAGSILNLVTSGSAGVPPLKFYGNATYPVPTNVPTTIDLASVLMRDGLLGLAGQISATGVTPLALKTSNGVSLEGNFFDSLGQYLGTETPGSSTLPGQSGLTDPSNLGSGVAGNPLYWAWNLALNALRDRYPTARYFVPLFFAASANSIATGGSHSAGIKIAI